MQRYADSVYYFKFGGRVVVNSLLVWYLFAPNVTRFFRIDAIPGWKRLLYLLGITGVAFGIFLLS